LHELFTGDHGEARFVWDPVVHKDNGEDLYYFFFRTGTSPQSMAVDLNELARQLCVPSFSAWLMCGQHDVALRAWMTHEDCELAEEHLKHKYSNFMRFDVRKTYYDDWTQHPPTHEYSLIMTHRPDVDVVARGAPAGSVTDSIDRLRAARLLHLHSVKDAIGHEYRGPYIRILTKMRRQEVMKVTVEEEQAKVRDVLLRLPEVRVKSVYCGNGADADYLVKGILRADHFDDLDTWLQRLGHSLESRGLLFRTTTLLALSSLVPESDEIDVDRNELDRDGRLFMRHYPPLATELRHKNKRNDFARELISQYWPRYHNTSFETIFPKLVHAYITASWEKFNEGSYFAREVEPCLDDLMRALLPDELGGQVEALALLRGILAQAVDERKMPASVLNNDLEMNFGAWQHVLGTLRKRGEFDAGSVLGADWVAGLEAARKVRNRLSHDGKAYQPRGDKEWREIVTNACDAGYVWVKIMASLSKIA
jgi:hypothetical protein